MKAMLMHNTTDSGLIIKPNEGHTATDKDRTVTDTVAAIVSAILALFFILLVVCVIRAIKKRRQERQGNRLEQPVVQTIAAGTLGAHLAAYRHVHVSESARRETVLSSQGSHSQVSNSASALHQSAESSTADHPSAESSTADHPSAESSTADHPSAESSAVPHSASVLLSPGAPVQQKPSKLPQPSSEFSISFPSSSSSSSKSRTLQPISASPTFQMDDMKIIADCSNASTSAATEYEFDINGPQVVETTLMSS